MREKRTKYYIKPSTVEGRKKLVSFLESQGYRYQEFMNREDVLSSFLPVVVDKKNKRIKRMENITMAACAATSNLLITDEEFYKIYREKAQES